MRDVEVVILAAGAAEYREVLDDGRRGAVGGGTSRVAMHD
jgi:hypothetical protein